FILEGCNLMKTVLVIIFWSTQLFAFNLTDLSTSIWGDYKVLETTESFNKEARYLECSFKSQSLLKEMLNGLIVEGTTFFPIEFKNINDKPTSIPGPLIGLSQQRSTFKDLGENGLVFKNQHRRCADGGALIGKISCLGKKWRTTSEMRIYDDIFKTKDVVVMELMYQPFDTYPAETCTFYKE
ncbi:MAG: hypothetical protein AAF203_11515, partial [Pseudomonadota bacterium]